MGEDDPFGVESAEFAIDPERLTATGVAVGTEPLPHRLDYHLETGTSLVTARLRVTSRGEGRRRELDLRRAASHGRGLPWRLVEKLEPAPAQSLRG